MNNEVTVKGVKSNLSPELMEKVYCGDLSKLTPEERLSYVFEMCHSLGLNPATKPFEYIILNGRLALYARKDATDQLRRIYGVSINKVEIMEADGIFCVTTYASLPDGRTDSDIGAVNIANLKGDARANAMMKAYTKSKRRVTLAICGLGMLDESEIETIPGAKVLNEIDVPKIDSDEKERVLFYYETIVKEAETMDELKECFESFAKEIKHKYNKDKEMIDALIKYKDQQKTKLEETSMHKSD
jgi:hypothetical protein